MSSSRYVPPPQRQALARARAERTRQSGSWQNDDDSAYDRRSAPVGRRPNPQPRQKLSFFNNNAPVGLGNRFDRTSPPPPPPGRGNSSYRDRGRSDRRWDRNNNDRPRGRGRRDNRFDTDSNWNRRKNFRDRDDRDFPSSRDEFPRRSYRRDRNPRFSRDDRDSYDPSFESRAHPLDRVPVRRSRRPNEPKREDFGARQPRKPGSDRFRFRDDDNDREPFDNRQLRSVRPGSQPRPQRRFENDRLNDDNHYDAPVVQQPNQTIGEPISSHTEEIVEEVADKPALQKPSDENRPPPEPQPPTSVPEVEENGTNSTQTPSADTTQEQPSEETPTEDVSPGTPKKITRKMLLQRRKKGGLVLVNQKKKLARARAAEIEKQKQAKIAKEKAKKEAQAKLAAQAGQAAGSYASIIKPQRKSGAKKSPAQSQTSSAQSSLRNSPQQRPMGVNSSPAGSRPLNQNGGGVAYGMQSMPALPQPRVEPVPRFQPSRTQDVRFSKPKRRSQDDNPFVSAEDAVSHVRHVKNFKTASNLAVTDEELHRLREQFESRDFKVLDIVVHEMRIFVAFERPSSAMAAQNTMEANGVVMDYVKPADAMAIKDQIAKPNRQATHSGVARRLLGNSLGAKNVKKLSAEERESEERTLHKHDVQRRIEKLDRSVREEAW